MRHLPVALDGAIQGIVSIGDIVKQRLETGRAPEVHSLAVAATVGITGECLRDLNTIASSSRGQSWQGRRACGVCDESSPVCFRNFSLLYFPCKPLVLSIGQTRFRHLFAGGSGTPTPDDPQWAVNFGLFSSERGRHKSTYIQCYERNQTVMRRFSLSIMTHSGSC